MEHSPITRRKFFWFGAAAGFLGHIAEETAVNLIAEESKDEMKSRWKLISNWFGRRDPRDPLSRDRRDLVYHLFLRTDEGQTKFFPAGNWSGGTPNRRTSSGDLTYGHEGEVCDSIEDFFHIDFAIPKELAESDLQSDGQVSKTIIGSGSSNSSAAEYLGTPEQPELSAGSVKLHYAIKQESGTLKRRQYGKEIERNKHAICDVHLRSLLVPEDESGWQKDDYLLVTRLPGEYPGSCITLFCGLHGPGTRAAELLFRPVISLQDLRKLADAINVRPGKTPFYQAVFRATSLDPNLKHDPTDSHVATKLELIVDKCPPVPLFPRSA
jgi:hypothetical protein